MRTAAIAILALGMAGTMGLGSGCANEAPTGITPTDTPLPSTGTGTEPDPEAQGVAKDFFLKNVYQELSGVCKDCHAQNNPYGPEWLILDNAEDAYALLKTYVSRNGLPMIADPNCAELTIYPVTEEHAGPTLVGDTLALVTEWLKREAVAAQGALDCAAPADPVDPAEPGALEQCNTALEEFRSCMSYSLFEYSEFADIGNQGTNEGQCYTCHASGTGGTLLSDNPLITFDAHKTDELLSIKLARCAIVDNEFLGLALADRYLNKGIENVIYPSGGQHPTYALDEARRSGHDMFMSLTLEAAKAGPDACAALDAEYTALLEQENQ